MKKNLIFAILLSGMYSFAVHCAAHGGDWYNRPLGQSTDTEQTSSNKVAKTKKQSVRWYKKPRVKYIAGAVISAGATLYAIQQYMKYPSIIPVAPDAEEQTTKDATTDKPEATPPSGTDVTDKKTDDETEKRTDGPAPEGATPIKVMVGGVVIAAVGTLIYGLYQTFA